MGSKWFGGREACIPPGLLLVCFWGLRSMLRLVGWFVLRTCWRRAFARILLWHHDADL